jgi:ribosomal protein S18 acetylase RimI-like enzyme
MLTIRNLQAADIQSIAQAFAELGWNKPASQYEHYLSQQDAGQREVLVAFVDGEFAGYVTIVWASEYEPFCNAAIPEIVDFNVLPKFRRRGIGTKLMDEAERRIAHRSPVAGIGVGMTADYGAAQRLYVRRGYLPDGYGLASNNRHLQHGDVVTVDDGLALMFTKVLQEG